MRGAHINRAGAASATPGGGLHLPADRHDCIGGNEELFRATRYLRKEPPVRFGQYTEKEYYQAQLETFYSNRAKKCTR